MALSKVHNAMADAVKKAHVCNNVHISKHGERLTKTLMDCLEEEHEENDKKNIQSAWTNNNEALAKMKQELEDVVSAINKPASESKQADPTLNETPTPSTSKRRQKSPKETSKKPRLSAPAEEFSTIPAKQGVITIAAVKDIITMPPVNPLPHMTYWAPIKTNILTADSEYLTHLPQLSEPAPKSREETKFFSKLKELYNGNTENDSEFLFKENPDIVRAMIVGLADLVKEFGLEILSSDSKSNSSCLNDVRIAQLAKRLMTDNETSVEPSDIPPAVFAAIASSDPDIGTAEDLQTWFIQTCGAISNMESKDAYEQQFCTICFTYKCITHPGITENNVAATQRALSAPRFCKSRKTTFQCKFPDCIKKNVHPNARRTHNQTKKHQGDHISTCLTNDWSQDDTVYCRSLFKTYENECFVAFIMQSKTCNQVRQFIETSERSGAPLSVPVKTPTVWNSTVSCSTATCAQSEAIEGAKKIPKIEIFPCSHKGNCGKNCSCVIGGTKCGKFCRCPNTCKQRVQGCTCKTTCSTKNCPCFLALKECDPDLCGSCRSNELVATDMTCRNVALQFGKGSNILLGVSTVSGWGAFAKRDLMKGQLVSEYVGEVISDAEADRRGFVYDERKHTYLFSLNNGYAVDGTNLGGKTRFMNSSETPNCVPKKMLVNGDNRIGIYALEDIKMGDELFFDYQTIIKKK